MQPGAQTLKVRVLSISANDLSSHHIKICAESIQYHDIKHGNSPRSAIHIPQLVQRLLLCSVVSNSL